MKLFKVLCLCLCLSGLLYLQSCDSSKSSKTKIEKVSVTGKEYTSKYICPMHCAGSGAEEMGTCPVCKMDYELNEEYKEN